MSDDRRFTERDLILARREGWDARSTYGVTAGYTAERDRRYPLLIEPTHVTLRGVVWRYHGGTWDCVRTAGDKGPTAAVTSYLVEQHWTSAELRAIADTIAAYHAQPGAPPEPTP